MRTHMVELRKKKKIEKTLETCLSAHGECRQNKLNSEFPSPLPSINSSWPCEPTSVLERKGAKSTIISRKRGQTEPRAISSFCVRDASREGVGTGRCSTRLFIGKSSGRGDVDVTTNRSGTRTTEISPDGFSPRSQSPNVSCSSTFPSMSGLPGSRITLVENK